MFGLLRCLPKTIVELLFLVILGLDAGQVLEAGKNNVGSGGFLQYSSSIMKDSVTNNWTFKNAPFDINKVYKVAISDFLMTGGEANLGFLTKDNPDIVKVYPVFTDLKDAKSAITSSAVILRFPLLTRVMNSAIIVEFLGFPRCTENSPVDVAAGLGD